MNRGTNTSDFCTIGRRTSASAVWLRLYRVGYSKEIVHSEGISRMIKLIYLLYFKEILLRSSLEVAAKITSYK